MSKLTVHHLGVSQSERVVWLCEELGIDYELVLHKRSPVFSPPELVKLSPLGAAPVIQDGDLTLSESGACVEYIAQTHGKGRFVVKPGEKNYADYLYWFHHANGTLQSSVGRGMLLGDSDTPIAQRFRKRFDDILSLVDKRLSEAPYLAGEEVSLADFMSVVSLTTMRRYYGYDLSSYSNILAYLKRVSERPGYQRARQKGDPDQDTASLLAGPPPPLFEALAAAKK